MSLTGTMALETGAPIDFQHMRDERRQRALDAMGRYNLDAMLLSQPANKSYVSGARALWKAGRSPFAPAMLLVRETGQVHMMGRWDFGVPKEIPLGNIYPMSWNPATILNGVGNALGSAAEGRLGIDQMTPGFSRLLSQAFPKASLVDATAAMWEARSVKTAEEIACLQTAIHIAEGALARTIADLRPGISERVLLGTFESHATAYGVTAPLSQGGFCVQSLEKGTDGELPFREMVSDRAVAVGDLITMGGGMLYSGYAADVGRTWLCGPGLVATAAQRDLAHRWRETLEAMASVCKPGKSAADLRKAAERVEPLPRTPVAHGIGQGYEPPIVGAGAGEALESTWELRPGMTLVLQPYVWREGVGGFWAKETVLITDDGHETLTNFPHGPLVSA